MMQYARLFIRMLRYRVAFMLLLFFFLGAAAHGKLVPFSVNYLLAAIALASSFTAATTLNDIADKEIDKINHPGNRGRPLVSGEATERDLFIVHAAAAVLSLASAFLIEPRAALPFLAALAINYAYSSPPFRLSHHTYLAPLALTVAYVVVAYWFGVIVAGDRFGRTDLLFVSALGTLFFGRIILKDFRDRAGDARYGKRTMLLRHGKPFVCALSMGAVVIGDVLLVTALRFPAILSVLLQSFILAILAMLHRLRRTSEAEQEQVAIGIAAKMGNGMLLVVLGLLVLRQEGAAIATQGSFALLLTAVFLGNFIYLASHPEAAIIGYRG